MQNGEEVEVEEDQENERHSQLNSWNFHEKTDRSEPREPFIRNQRVQLCRLGLFLNKRTTYATWTAPEHVFFSVTKYKEIELMMMNINFS